MTTSRHSAFIRFLVSASLVASAGVGAVVLASPSQAAGFAVSIDSHPDNPTNSTDASIGFSTNADPSDTVTFTCSEDGATPSTCTSPFTDSGLTEGAHTFEVVATDNDTSETDQQDFDWTVDTTPPSVNITAAPTGTVATKSATIAFTDGDSVSDTCSLDHAPATDCASPKTYTNLSDGTHSVAVTGTDAAGNSAQDFATWTVDTTGPTIAITSAPSGTVATDSATIAFTDGDSTGDTCKLDGGTATACTSPKTYSNLSDGSHTVVVTGVDSLGNPGSDSATWTVDTTGPTVNITSAPTGTVGSDSASISFTKGDASSVTCKLDNGTATNCTSPTTYTNLSEGSHTVVVTGLDAVGNPGSDSATWTVDTTAPTLMITAAPTGTVSNKTASIQFTNGSDATSVTCSLDGATATACTSPQQLSGLADADHTFTVTAKDAVGNANVQTASWTVDTTGPALTISSPATGTVNTSSVTIDYVVSTSDTDNSSFMCEIDSGGYSACDSATSNNFTGLSDGAHTLRVRVADVLGNTTTKSVTRTIDTVAPTVNITSPAANSFDKTTSASVAFTTGGSPTSTTCSLDGATATACTSPQSYTGLSQGAHTVTVTVTDAATNTASDSVTFTVDSIAPTVTISSPSGGDDISSVSQDIVFSLTDNPTTVTCALDGGTATSCTSPQHYASLAQGSHTVVITATDAAGNSGSDTVTWTVDTVAPTVTITSPAGSADLNTATQAVAFTTAGSPTGITCSLDGATAAACTSPKSYASLAEGSHTVVVTATDAAGNTGSDSVTWTVDTTAPTLTISSAATGLVNTKSVTVAYTAEPGATLTCAVDSGAFAACGSATSNTFANLADTATATAVRTLRVRATDAAGNTNDQTVTREVDTVAPTASFSSAPSGTTKSRSATVAYSATDLHTPVTFQCALDSAAYGPCSNSNSSPISITGLTNGQHTEHLEATDAAGNTSTVTASWTVNVTCSISVPTKVVIGAFDALVTGKTASDCGTDFHSANWNIVNPQNQTAADGFDFVSVSNPDDLVWTLYDTDSLGTYTMAPQGAEDSSGLATAQNTVKVSVRLGSRLSISSSRHTVVKKKHRKKIRSSVVTIGITATKYVPGLTYRPWSGRAVTLQYRTCSTCGWKTLRTVTTNSSGKASFSFKLAAKRYYRAVNADYATVWGATTGAVYR